MEKINGYTLDAPLKNDNSGTSKWGFARRFLRTYFIKEFLTPVYPLDTAALSPETIARRRAACDAFECAKVTLYNRINSASRGSLVRIEEFFRSGSRYYIVTERVKTDEAAPPDPAALPFSERITLCRSVAFAFQCLHQGGVVHGDVKPGNILLYRLPSGRCAAKVIDFDCSFLAEMPPKNGDELGCDLLYLAPEALMLMQGAEVTLGPEIDVFALGLVFHEYLTGQLPEFDADTFGYPCGAALAGMQMAEEAPAEEMSDDAATPETAGAAEPAPRLLKVDETLPPEVRELLEGMLEPDPEKRLTLAQVSSELKKLAEPPAAPSPEPEPKPEPVSESTPRPSPDPVSWFHAAGDL